MQQSFMEEVQPELGEPRETNIGCLVLVMYLIGLVCGFGLGAVIFS